MTYIPFPPGERLIEVRSFAGEVDFFGDGYGIRPRPPKPTGPPLVELREGYPILPSNVDWPSDQADGLVALACFCESHASELLGLAAGILAALLYLWGRG